MNKRIIACLSLIMMSIVANANEKHSNQCLTLLSQTPYLELLGNPTVENMPEGCRLLNGNLSLNHFSNWKFSSIDVKGGDLISTLSHNKIPSTIDISVQGIQFSVNHNPITDYITSIQQEPFNLHLSYEWNNNTLNINDFSLKSDYLGELIFQAQLGLPSFPSNGLEKLTAPPEVSFNSFSIKLINKKLFQSFIVPGLIARLSTDEDISSQIEGYRQQAITIINNLHPQTADESSKKALREFIQAFPKPVGTTTLSVSAVPPIQLENLDTSSSLEEVLKLITQLKLKASYDPDSLLNNKELCR